MARGDHRPCLHDAPLAGGVTEGRGQFRPRRTLGEHRSVGHGERVGTGQHPGQVHDGAGRAGDGHAAVPHHLIRPQQDGVHPDTGAASARGGGQSGEVHETVIDDPELEHRSGRVQVTDDVGEHQPRSGDVGGWVVRSGLLAVRAPQHPPVLPGEHAAT